MIFAHTWEKVLSGQKTQTRRPVKFMDGYITVPDTLDEYRKVMTAKKKDFNDHGLIYQGFSSRVRYEVGKTYAVQPGRAKKAVARIEITGIRREDVRDISDVDVMAEGFSYKYDFLNTWTRMYDPSMGEWYMETEFDPNQPEHCPVFLRSRPAERYLAWVLEFRLVSRAGRETWEGGR